MKINIISSFDQPRLVNEYKVLEFIFKKHFKNLVINKVDYYKFTCDIADINIFLDTINDILTSRARYNIYIPNHEYIYRNWGNSLVKFDRIFVKSNYSYEILKNYSDNVVNVGWSTKDVYNHTITGGYDKAIYFNISDKNTEMLINVWKEEYPQLLIINAKEKVNKPNIEFKDNVKDDNELVKLFNLHKLFINLPEVSGYSNNLIKAGLCKSVLISPNMPPLNEINGLNLVKIKKKAKYPNYFINKYTIDENSLDLVIKDLVNKTEKELQDIGETSRENCLSYKRNFELNMKKELDFCMKESRKIDKVNETNLEDKDLPNISIITPTYNHSHMIKLMMLNYNMTNYPMEKREWIIIDDGERKLTELPSEEIRKKLNIKYFSLDEKLPLGEKRNYGVSKASHDIIVFMDDDDFYPPNSVKNRVSSLVKHNMGCIGCTTIGYFEINKMISTIFMPTYSKSLEDRVSEATLCFTKKFWEDRNFNNSSESFEAKDFLKGRNKEFLEITWEDNIVGLLHNRNHTQRVTTGNEPNGCHFKWSDELFLFITNLDKEQ